jgi:glycosyltransferase involved in cell wall biosynthesis
MLTNTYWPHVGGVARAVDTLAGESRRAGHDVQVIAPGFPGDEHEDDGNVVRVPALQNFNGSDFSVRVPIPRVIGQRIEHFDPEIVHAHHPLLLGDAALRIAYQRNLPLVFTHHTLYENYTHYVPFDSQRLKRFVIRLATSYANGCDAVIAPSQSVGQLLRERGVEAPVEVVPTGVDTGAFADSDGAGFRQERGIPPDARVIGHVGRLAREKNLPFLGEAVAAALQHDPGSRFLLVGDGPESRALQQRFEQAGVADRVLATGKLTGQTLRSAYAAMDVFAFASHTETQGMVLAEAMAAGVPVVALDGPGVRDVVADDVNGRLLAANAREDQMAQALLQALETRRRRAWEAAVRETARRFDQARCAARVIEIYRSLGAERRAAATDWSWWNRLLGRIEAEWELISSKADSAGDSFRTRRPG